MKSRMCYQQSVTSGQPLSLTPEIWDQLIDSPEVKNICSRIAALDPTAEDYNDRKQALKKRLPIIIPHAQSFKNGKRISADAVQSGLAMLDVDHVDNPQEWFESIDKQLLSDNRIYLVAITASGKGLRIIGERMTSSIAPELNSGIESIEAAQLRIATALNIPEYDAVTKDLARASYIVPRDYILWIYEAGLLYMPEHVSAGAWTNVPLALPPHNPDERSGQDSPDSPEYRGIPYSSIVQQLMLSIGAAEGAVQGERNTVYFSLAAYMRYICDFNASLLFQILPDFGLSEQERRLRYRSSAQKPNTDGAPIGYRYLRKRASSGRAIAFGEIHSITSARTAASAQTGLPPLAGRLSRSDDYRQSPDPRHVGNPHPLRVPRPPRAIAFVLLMYHGTGCIR